MVGKDYKDGRAIRSIPQLTLYLERALELCDERPAITNPAPPPPKRAPAPPKKPPKKKAAEKSGDTPAINQEVEKARWKELTDPVMSWQAKPYDRHRTYQAGAFILHKQEGMGYVESSDDGELIALFKGGLVSLPHGQEREE